MVPKSEIYNQNRVSKRTHHSTAFKPSIKLIFESISKSYSKSDIIPSILFEFSINNCMVQYRKIEIDASKDSSDIALMFPLKNCVLANFSVSDLSILMPLPKLNLRKYVQVPLSLRIAQLMTDIPVTYR